MTFELYTYFMSASYDTLHAALFPQALHLDNAYAGTDFRSESTPGAAEQ